LSVADDGCKNEASPSLFACTPLLSQTFCYESQQLAVGASNQCFDT
jgi:hypothetical protein